MVSTSQTAVTWTSDSLRSACRLAKPRAPQPITPTVTRLLGEGREAEPREGREAIPAEARALKQSRRVEAGRVILRVWAVPISGKRFTWPHPREFSNGEGDDDGYWCHR